MDNLQILKNPIIVSVVVIVLVFGYFYWDKSRKEDNFSIFEMDMSNYIIPLVAGAFVYFLMIALNSSMDPVEITETEYSESSIDPTSNDSYRLIGKNRIKLPKNDILIDISRF